MTALLSVGVRANVTALKSIQSDMQAVQRRLATGKRVNEASDNATAFFTASSLNSRAASISGLIDGISNAKGTVAAANKALSSIESLVTSARGLAQQALDTSKVLAKVTGSVSTLTTTSQIATTAGSSTRLKAGDTITVSDGTTTATYTAANNDTAQTFLNAVNNTAGIKVTASLNNGAIQLAATGNNNITIGGTNTGAGTTVGVVGLSSGATNYVANSAKASLASQFDAIRGQIDQLAKDASFNGSNLANGGTLTVKLGEDSASQVSLTGADASSNGLGLSASVGQFQADSDITAALTSITSALSTLKAQGGVLGSQQTVLNTREDFTKALVDTLTAGADALVATDLNDDSAALLALQTRQQVAATSLSLTQSSDTAVLRLFGIG